MVVVFKFDVAIKFSCDGWQGFYKLCLGVCILLLYCCEHVKGLVDVSPSVVAPVCRVEDQLELTCSVTGQFIRWEFTAISESGVAMTFTRTVTSAGPTGVTSDPLIVNSTITFTFSRLSSQGSSPLVSRIIINPVSEGLNGVQVNCEDVATSESATTTIQIIGDAQQTASLNIQPHSEEFSSDSVVVMLEWTLTNLNRYQQLLLPNISVNVDPAFEVVIMQFIGNMSIQLIVPYNRQFNVSITQPGICGQPNQTAFIVLSYTKCYNPMVNADHNLIIEGYEDPALEGENITFSCREGLTLIGPQSSICMGNGDWESDPSEVNCTTGLVTTGVSTVTLSTCSNPLYVLQIEDPSVSTDTGSLISELNKTSVCCSGFLITKSNRTTCLENGEWELKTSQMKGMPDPATAMLRTALITVTSLSIIISALMLVIGFVCGHYFSQRQRKSAASDQNRRNVSNTTNEREQDLELKENVAYITLHPK